MQFVLISDSPARAESLSAAVFGSAAQTKRASTLVRGPSCSEVPIGRPRLAHDGSIMGWTENAIAVCSDSPQGLIDDTGRA